MKLTYWHTRLLEAKERAKKIQEDQKFQERKKIADAEHERTLAKIIQHMKDSGNYGFVAGKWRRIN